MSKKLKNISTQQEDIYKIDQLNEKFDLIFCRFLFINLTNPMLAIEKLHTRRVHRLEKCLVIPYRRDLLLIAPIGRK